MATAEAALAALESIARDMRLLVAHFGADGHKQVAGTSSTATGAVAPDHVLDGQYGDPLVKKKDPRDWTGDPMKNKKFSECPAEYLEMVAEREDYFLEQNQEKLAESTDADEAKALKENIKYNQKDAARARGWAARKRAGWKPTEPEPTADPNPMTADEIPF